MSLPPFDPSNPDHLWQAASNCLDAGDYSRLKANLVRLIGIRPEHADAHNCLGQALLAEGEWLAGWRESEWDVVSQFPGAPIPPLGSMAWNGMRLPDDRIVVLADRGYGDIFQFCRFISVVATMCREVALVCDPDLATFMSRVSGVSGVYTRWMDVPSHAAHIRLTHVPMVLGITEDTIPRQGPYLRALPARYAAWERRLSARDNYRVGLCWAGSSVHPGRINRILAEEAFAPLYKVKAAQFTSLMWSDALFDWDETAALIHCLDLVITVDTSIAHLAGAMGKRVWILLGKPFCWRWLLERTDSPWYPTARLFRQRENDNYAPIIAEAAVALRELLR